MRFTRALTVGGLAVTLVAAGTVSAYAIVGGREVSSAPWAVELVDTGCTASMIGPRWVITAWHCFEDDPWTAEQVRVGDARKGEGQLANVKQLHHRYDILLIELDRDVEAGYLKLTDTEPPVDANVDIYGWGGICDDGDCGGSDVLKVAQMQVEQVGEKGDDGSRKIDLRQNGDGHAAGGDSGGPALWDGKLIGVLSGGSTTGDGKGVEGYASVHNVADWIEEITGITSETPATPTTTAPR